MRFTIWLSMMQSLSSTTSVPASGHPRLAHRSGHTARQGVQRVQTSVPVIRPCVRRSPAIRQPPRSNEQACCDTPIPSVPHLRTHVRLVASMRQHIAPCCRFYERICPPCVGLTSHEAPELPPRSALGHVLRTVATALADGNQPSC